MSKTPYAHYIRNVANEGRGATMAKLLHDCADRVDDLETELAALREDAERYLFLRDEEYPETLLEMLIKAGVHKSEVDAAIDAARKESK